MTDTPPSTALERLPATEDAEVQRWARLGMWLAAAEQPDPSPRDLGAAAALRLALASEMGLPLRAASELSIIRGRLVISALLMRGLAQREGYRVVPLERSDTTCTAAVLDPVGREMGRTTFTIEDAKRAGLVRSGGNWQTWPGRMLWARASSLAIRDYLPHIALGLLTTEEASAITGEVIDVEPEPPEAEPAPEVVEPAQTERAEA
jgi:hypothetical protein